MNETIRMQISAFVDGELPDNEAELLLRRMCQDNALREQAAEYLDIGRVMRAEVNVRGVDQLRERINAELDERPMEPAAGRAEGGARRGWRPVVGVAIAAGVAVVALFAFREVAVDPLNANSLLADKVAETDANGAYTVPPNEEVLRQYMMSHGAGSSEAGANGISARWVSLEFSQEVAADAAPGPDDPDSDVSSGD